jgi:hypothetical protein
MPTPPRTAPSWISAGVLANDSHSGEGMSDLYDKIKSNVAFRKEMAEKAGLGFELPSKIIVIGRNGRKLESTRDLEMTATA